uniref:Uncharacterized protein n=1 Tax=Heterorhabditis bacteriophora TaxID=37862 RepID=A0A1I7WJP2_HETBA
MDTVSVAFCHEFEGILYKCM